MNTNGGKEPIEILLVEDNPGDIRLTKEAFKDCKIESNLSVVMDGDEAIEYLKREGKYQDSVKPQLVLLDLNLPKINGLEVLKEIKSNVKFKMIPVIILTTSKAEEDIVNAYTANANCYINKPVDLDGFYKIIESIEYFWFSTAVFPPKS